MSGTLTPAGSINDLRTQAHGVIGERLSNLDLTQLLIYVINNVTPSALPFLAWQFDVLSPFWQLLSPGTSQAQLIENSISLHRTLGTPYAVKTSLNNLNWAYVTILEGQSSWGGNNYPVSEGWAVFRIYIALGELNWLESSTPAPQPTNTCQPTAVLLSPINGDLVFQHTRGTGADNNCGALRIDNVTPATQFTGGVWVYIPSSWAGSAVYVEIEGAGALTPTTVVYANLAFTNQWQFLQMGVSNALYPPNNLPDSQPHIVLRITDATAGQTIYSSGWVVNSYPIQIAPSIVTTTAQTQVLDAINFFKPARSVLDSLWFKLGNIQEPDIPITDRFTLSVGPIQVEPNIPITDLPTVVGWAKLDVYTANVYYNGRFYYSGMVNHSGVTNAFVGSGPITVNGQVISAT